MSRRLIIRPIVASASLVLAACAWGELPGAEAYVAARAFEVEGKHADAIRRYGACAERMGPLAPYALVRVAHCQALAGNVQGAEAAFRHALERNPVGPWTRMAKAELAVLLSEQSRHLEAHPLFSEAFDVGFVPWWWGPWRLDAAKNAVADTTVRTEGYAMLGELAEAGRYRKTRVDAAALLMESPDPRRRLVAAFALLRAGEYKQATEALEGVEPASFAGDADRLAYARGRVLVAANKPIEGRATLRQVAETYPASPWAPLALKSLVLSLHRARKTAEAGKALDLLMTNYPTSEEAGDTLWWAAWSEIQRNHSLQAVAFYERLASKCPGHARAGQALVEAAGIRAGLGERDKALKLYATALERHPNEPAGAEAGYRSGRIREKTKDAHGALADYVVAARGPIGNFFAHRARARADWLKAPAAQRGPDPDRSGLASFVGPIPVDAPPIALAPRSWLGQPWYQRLRFFAEHGFEEDEWEALALRARQARLVNEGPLYSVLADAGLARTAAAFVTQSDWGLEDGEPTIARLRVLYPRAFWGQFSALARETGIDPYLLLAVGRQESTFRARIQSSVGATGVMQLMPRTASWIVGLEAALTPRHVRSLTNPQNSVRLGAYYLVRMHEQFDGDLVYALAAYNGGPGNVRKWKRRHRSADRAEFVGAIPFTETRGFVQKVLGNYGAYLSLYPMAND